MDYTIDEAAARTGLTKHTLRYCEREGLLPPITKATSGHRRDADDDLGWVRMLQLLRAAGMPNRGDEVACDVDVLG
jgi:DNA-binding transcriptional MerR regulator